MNICVCDLCGARFDQETQHEEFKSMNFNIRLEGYFTADWHQTVCDGDGKILGHNWGDDLDLCTVCTKKIDEAIWQAIDDIRKEAPQSRNYKQRGPFKKFMAKNPPVYAQQLAE